MSNLLLTTLDVNSSCPFHIASEFLHDMCCFVETNLVYRVSKIQGAHLFFSLFTVEGGEYIIIYEQQIFLPELAFALSEIHAQLASKSGWSLSALDVVNNMASVSWIAVGLTLWTFSSKNEQGNGSEYLTSTNHTVFLFEQTGPPGNITVSVVASYPLENFLMEMDNNNNDIPNLQFNMTDGILSQSSPYANLLNDELDVDLSFQLAFVGNMVPKHLHEEPLHLIVLTSHPLPLRTTLGEILVQKYWVEYPYPRFPTLVRINLLDNLLKLSASPSVMFLTNQLPLPTVGIAISMQILDVDRNQLNDIAVAIKTFTPSSRGVQTIVRLFLQHPLCTETSKALHLSFGRLCVDDKLSSADKHKRLAMSYFYVPWNHLEPDLNRAINDLTKMNSACESLPNSSHRRCSQGITTKFYCSFYIVYNTLFLLLRALQQDGVDN